MTASDRAPLAGRTIVMSGGSRGIGLAIALRAAQDGANVVLLAKTDTPHERLKGTVHEAADEIRRAGGRAVAVVGDVRSDDSISAAVDAAVQNFGGVDICINNASALVPRRTEDITPSQFDLMQDVNVRGTFMLTRACLPHLRRSESPHVLTLSPPLNLSSQYWLARFPGYLLSKYGMTLLTLAFAAEFREHGISVNALWPRTTIATDAVKNLLGGEEALARSRRPEIVADAAHAILTSGGSTGQTFIDDEVLRAAGVEDLSGYAATPGATDFEGDFFLGDLPGVS